MMKKAMFFIGAVALLVGANYAFSDEGLQTIRFEKKNTAALRLPFTSSTVDTLKAKLLELSQTLPAKEDIYLYLNTPGGSVIAGQELKTVIHGIKNKVHVIAQFAASMGYMTTQATTGNRYVTPDGILMAHRAELSVEGQTPGEIGVRLSFFERLTDEMAESAAKRTGISIKDYQSKVEHEYWVSGTDAVKDKQADAVVNVTCSADLSGTTSETLYTMFGPVVLEWSDCPLITGPVAIHLPEKDLGGGFSDSEYNNFVRTVHDMLTKSKIDIVDDKTLNNNYYHYVR